MKKILLLAMVAMFILVAGCDKQPPPEQKNDSPKTVQTEKPEQKPAENKPEKPAAPQNDSGKKIQSAEVKVYYPDESGTKLVPVEKKIQFANESEKYSAALSELMQKPKDKNLTTVFPSHAKVKSVTREGDTAVVDFDSSIVKGFVGGSTGEEFLVNSVVDTLTEFNEIKQVKFLIDGQEIETLSGHMDLSEPVKRADKNG